MITGSCQRRIQLPLRHPSFSRRGVSTSRDGVVKSLAMDKF